MGLSNFIPELWSARLNAKLRASLVFGSVVNTDYQGTIGDVGDVVRINQVGEVTVGDYVRDTTEVTPEVLTDYQTSLTIDKAKYIAFKVDDLDRAQAQPGYMDEAMRSAAWGLKNAADKDIAALYDQAGGIVASTEIDSTNALALLLTMGQKLSEFDVPGDGRWAVLPPWILTKLTLAKVLVVDGGAAADAFANGWRGRAGGFDVYESNNVYTDVTAAGTGTPSIWYPMAGTRKAISFASQINKLENFRIEKGFADGVKGLYNYGVKCVYPDALVSAITTVGAEA